MTPDSSVPANDHALRPRPEEPRPRLPSEAEWEYAARAGNTAVTDRVEVLPFLLPGESELPVSWGSDQPPNDFGKDGQPPDDFYKDQLLADFGDERRTAADENAFGLAAMGAASEIRADVWIAGYVGASADARPRTGDGPRVVRGGAADAWPWQGCGEWILGLAAIRWKHWGFASIRPVAPLPTYA